MRTLKASPFFAGTSADKHPSSVSHSTSGGGRSLLTCDLGESPCWMTRINTFRQSLSWVDITTGRFFHFDPTAGSMDVIHVRYSDQDEGHGVESHWQDAQQLSSLGSGAQRNTAVPQHLCHNASQQALFSLPPLCNAAPSAATTKKNNAPPAALLTTGEVEVLGFALPTADPDIFVCGSQRGIFYLSLNDLITVREHASQSPLHSVSLPQPTTTTSPNTSPCAPLLGGSGSGEAMTVFGALRERLFIVRPASYLFRLHPTNRLATASATTASTHTNRQKDKDDASPPRWRVRFNDAKVDRSGRLFAGTMCMRMQDPIGELVVLDMFDAAACPDQNCHDHQHQHHDHDHHHHHSHHDDHPHPHPHNHHGPPPAPGSGSLLCSSAFSMRSLRNMEAFRGPAKAPVISNGLDWSPSNDKMYYIDSPRRRIDVFEYSIFAQHQPPPASKNEEKKNKTKDDADEALSFRLSDRRVLVDLERCVVASSAAASATNKDSKVKPTVRLEGYPDGMCVDEEGHLWVALWEGGRVICIDPTTRQVISEVIVPNVSRVTSVCFGGPALSWLIITTAAKAGEPDSGTLFFCPDTGKRGLPATGFRGLPQQRSALITGDAPLFSTQSSRL